MRCYFIRNAKIVADTALPGLSPHEVIESARRMFETSSYDGFEIWTLNRRIYWEGTISKSKTKPARRPRLIPVRLAVA
jgi:hypothetical protein